MCSSALFGFCSFIRSIPFLNSRKASVSSIVSLPAPRVSVRGPFRSLVAACSCPSQTMCSQITTECVRKAIGRWDSLRAGESIGRSLAASRSRPPSEENAQNAQRAGRHLIENQSRGENNPREGPLSSRAERGICQRDSSAGENTGRPNDDEMQAPEVAGHGIPRGVYLDAFVRRAA